MKNMKQILDLVEDFDEVQRAQLVAAIVFSPTTTVNESANILSIQNILFAAVSDMTKNDTKFTYPKSKEQMTKFFEFNQTKLDLPETKELIEVMLQCVVIAHEKTH